LYSAFEFCFYLILISIVADVHVADLYVPLKSVTEAIQSFFFTPGEFYSVADMGCSLPGSGSKNILIPDANIFFPFRIPDPT
jgi:hypothetical protein